jgi:hypothetical protein
MDIDELAVVQCVLIAARLRRDGISDPQTDTRRDRSSSLR